MRQALKSVWSRAGIEQMEQKLANLRSELNTFVLVELR
jgi:hypothetical protein